MALPLYNASEGTAGASITTAAGADTSGTSAMDVISGSGITFTSGSAHGVGWRFTTAATVVAAYLGWTTSLGTLTTGQTLYVRWYYRPGSATVSSSVRMMTILNGTTALLDVRHASGTGTVAVAASGTSQTPDTTGALSANTWYRIEAQLTGIGGGTTAGGYTVTVYLGDTNTVVGNQITGSGKNFGTLAPNTIRFGITTANATVSTTYDFDDVAVSATGMPAIPGGSPKNIAVNQVSEVDSAQPLTFSQINSAYRNDAYGTGLYGWPNVATGPVTNQIAVGQVVETETSQPLTEKKIRALGQPSGTNTAQPIRAGKSRTVGQPIETDTSQTYAAKRKIKTILQTLETDSGLGALVHRKTKTLLQTLETDSVTALFGRQKIRAFLQALESDTPQTISPVTPYVAAVKADAPKAYWRMNANSSTQPEESGGPSMALTGATPNVSGAFPGLGPAVSFNGTTDYGRVSAVDLSATDKVTIEMWLSWDTNGSNDALALEHGETNAAKGFAVDPNSSFGGGNFTAFTPNVAGGSFYEERMTTRPSAATFHHIVVTIDRTQTTSGAVIGFYLDGVADSGIVDGAPTIPTGLFQNYPLMVMARSAASNGTKSLFGSGDMQHLAIYDKILSPTRVSAHYGAVVGASHTLTIGQVSESDTVSSPFVRRKIKSFLQTLETDSALGAMRAFKSRTLSQPVETDTSQTFAARTKIKAFGQPLETDSGLGAFTRRKTRLLGQPLGTNTAQPTTALGGSRQIKQILETDTAQTFVTRKLKAFAQALETNTSQAMRALKSRTLTQPVESDLSQTLAAKRKIKTLLQPVESDTSTTFGRTKQKSLGQPLESDSVTAAFVSRKLRTMLQAIESDASQTFGRAKQKLFGQTLETDAALGPYVARLAHFMQQIVETDTSQTLAAKRKTKVFGQPIETNTSQTFGRVKYRLLTQPVETDTPQAVRPPRKVNMITESDQVFALTRIKYKRLSQPFETDSVTSPFLHRKIGKLSIPTEADLAQIIGRLKRRNILQTNETDSAQPQHAAFFAVVNRVIETDTTFPITTIGVTLNYTPRSIGQHFRQRPGGKIRSGSRGKIRS